MGNDRSDAREEQQRRLELMEARRLANELRSSEDPRWSRLRGKLEEAGVSINDVLIGELGVEGSALESGIVVTRGGRAFRFDFSVDDGAGHQVAYEDARVSEFIEEGEALHELYRRYWAELDRALSEE